MNIGKTAALVTAAAGAVVFGGSDAGAFPWDNPIQQVNDCDSKNGVSVSGAGGRSDCLNFAQIFGDPHGVVQQNHCDSSVGATANMTILAPAGGSEIGSQCANIAVSARPQSKAAHRGTYGEGGYGNGLR
ncbi:hypothetical protein [Streptomyces sp. ME19-01-6]|uniref:hypothetical protein n=1 Tax=Streptomyces sp. ME19-01-6 TaxID=3028686 RepID=UPI0029BC0DD1|nr:hypothetical protein [Streptomyces sp. ME19-01-6]MDX3229812.1 hypothetical protein [Streptomyces sp. ME19-01-6]